MRWGGSIGYCLFRSLSLSAKVKELLKSDHICQSYRKNGSGCVLSGTRCVCHTRTLIISLFAWLLRCVATEFAIANQTSEWLQHNHTVCERQAHHSAQCRPFSAVSYSKCIQLVAPIKTVPIEKVLYFSNASTKLGQNFRIFIYTRRYACSHNKSWNFHKTAVWFYRYNFTAHFFTPQIFTKTNLTLPNLFSSAV